MLWVGPMLVSDPWFRKLDPQTKALVEKAAKEAAAAAGQDAPETDPHFYMAKSHLFNALQVEKSKR